jgi:hypothetical protein
MAGQVSLIVLTRLSIRYNGSLVKALQFIYPYQNWSSWGATYRSGASKSQHILYP